MRHMEAWRKGEKQDEIGTHHIANAISNLMFILEKELRGWEDVNENSAKEVDKSVDNTLPSELWYPDDSGEWIEYDGSGQPVEDLVLVEAMHATERERKTYRKVVSRANGFLWGWDDDFKFNIVAYKVVK